MIEKRTKSHEFTILRELPQVIDKPYPFIAIADLNDVAGRFDPTITEKDLSLLQQRLFGIQKKYMPEGSTFHPTSSAKLNKGIYERLEDVAKDPQKGIVILDRYIGEQINYPNQFRLDISRGSKKDLIKRPGTSIEPAEQLAQMSDWIRNGRFSSLIFVDDVLATGGSLQKIITSTKEKHPDVDATIEVGLAYANGTWTGVEKMEAAGIPVNANHYIHVSPEKETSYGGFIAASRDMTIFGGSLSSDMDNGSICYPKFLPFTLIESKDGFVEPDKRIQASNELLQFNNDLIIWLERRLGKTITFQDLLDRGFSRPDTNITSIKAILSLPSQDTPVVNYLQDVSDLLQDNRGRLDQIISDQHEREARKA